ncbi:MAG: endonuclease/exonuclease/phosphatase family protein [Actinomycetaceae bacterium]|nr:endonuclease/exonuclease/phosphatase family protein [Actinomycetaceae bacterium]
MTIVAAVLAGILSVLAVASVRPDFLGITSDLVLRTPLAQIMSARIWLAAVFLLVAMLFMVVAAARGKRSGRGRIAGTLAIVFLMTGVLHGGIVLDRGWKVESELGEDYGITADGYGDGSITVLTYNTLGGETSMEALADVVVANGVDVIVLPETATARGDELVGLLGQRGLEFQHFDTGIDMYDAEFRSTILLVADSLGQYRMSDLISGTSAAVAAEPVSGEGPVFVGVHPIAPLPEFIDSWQAEIDAVYALCATDTPLVMAGDFNSTVDHQLALGYHCTDAARQAGSGAVGTWPSFAPAKLGVPIDRVVHDGSLYEGTSAAVIEVGDSDHRGLLVRLTPLAG